MENQNTVIKAADAEITQLLSVLDNFENKVKTDHRFCEEEIKRLDNLYKDICDKYLKLDRKHWGFTEKDKYSEAMNYFEQMNTERSFLSYIYRCFECIIAHTYFKCFEKPSITQHTLLEVQTKYLKFVEEFKVLESARLILLINYSKLSIKLDALHKNEFYQRQPKILEKSECLASFDTTISKFPLISPAIIIPLQAKNLICDTVNKLFRKESIATRIYIAIILDNQSLVRLFFKEYESEYSDKKLMDFIVNNSLAGLASANGCIEVMKLLIEMNVNLEQKFTINPVKNKQHPKTVLNKYNECTLEMTPLALALCAAPVLEREKAKTLISVLLVAGANTNKKIIKTWVEKYGYYDRQEDRTKTAHISMFDFDQTGILEELVKEQSKVKKTPQQKKHHHYNKLKNNIANIKDSQVIELQTEIKRLSVKVSNLEKEINNLRDENTLLRDQVKELKAPELNKENIKEKSVIVIQKMFRAYHVYKQYPLSDLKEEQKKNVHDKSGVIIGKLLKKGHFDQAKKLMEAIENKQYYEATKLINMFLKEEETSENSAQKLSIN